MPDIFGFHVSAPSIPSFSDVRNAVSHGVTNVENFGHAALDRASDLGRQGTDLGRRFVADPDGTTRAVASAARRGITDVADSAQKGIAHATEVAQHGIHDGVMWTGHKIHEGADAARAAVPGGDNVISNAVRNQITSTENQARFAVGAVGGVTNEAVGLVGSVSQLAVKGVELQAKAEVGALELAGSSSARADFALGAADLAQRSGQAIQQSGQAVQSYAASVAADPGRLGRDVQGAADATWDSTKAGAGSAWNGASGFVQGQYDEIKTAAANGQGPETLGFKTGQVASYFIPVGGEAKAVLGAGEIAVRATVETTARATTEAAAKGVTETLARTGTEALARDTAGTSVRAAGTETRVVELTASSEARAAAETKGADLVARADAAGSAVRVARNGGITAQDLAGATRASGREVALYRDAATGERYLAVGSKTGVEVPQGAKLIAHTQPGIGADAVRASVADEAALTRLGQRSSVIIDEGGTAATRFRATEEGAAAARTGTGAARLNAPLVGEAELTAFRSTLGKAAEMPTAAVAKTDIPSLASHTFGGASSKVLEAAGRLPQSSKVVDVATRKVAQAADAIRSPFAHSSTWFHAEADIANQFRAALKHAGLTEADTVGRSLSIHVSQEVCGSCKAGLKDVSKPAGILKQLSQAYPKMKIEVTAEGTNEVIKLLNGARIR